ncbi:hypothetical protein B0H11DRAFT_1934107 [Mycena galericulata]|nr:hypothetical protein B0H11DRAFT_1934107 [Mycena galericulata]
MTRLLSAIHRAKEPKKASLKALFRVVVRKTHGPAKPALERIWVHYTVYTFTDNMDHAYIPSLESVRINSEVGYEADASLGSSSGNRSSGTLGLPPSILDYKEPDSHRIADVEIQQYVDMNVYHSGRHVPPPAPVYNRHRSPYYARVIRSGSQTSNSRHPESGFGSDLDSDWMDYDPSNSRTLQQGNLQLTPKLAQDHIWYVQDVRGNWWCSLGQGSWSIVTAVPEKLDNPSAIDGKCGPPPDPS